MILLITLMCICVAARALWSADFALALAFVLGFAPGWVPRAFGFARVSPTIKAAPPAPASGPGGGRGRLPSCAPTRVTVNLLVCDTSSVSVLCSQHRYSRISCSRCIKLYAVKKRICMYVPLICQQPPGPELQENQDGPGPRRKLPVTGRIIEMKFKP